VSLLSATLYNDAIHDLFQCTFRGITYLLLLCDSSRDGGRAPWIVAKGLELHFVSRQEDDRKIGALGYAVTLRRVPRNINPRRYDSGDPIDAEEQDLLRLP
jgi:hypothetical protein